VKKPSHVYEKFFIKLLSNLCYNASDMLKNLRLFAILYGISLGYAFFQNNFLLSFLNAIGYISIFMLVITLYLYLERFGYFDVFGYSFKKTYYIFSRKQETLDEEQKEKFSSFYNYVQSANQSRILVKLDFLIISSLFIILNFALSFIFALINP